MLIIASISMDAPNAGKEDVDKLLIDGQLLHVVGWLNTRWNDLSAQYLAWEAELNEVEWEVLSDDTGGTLILTILYPLLTKIQVEERLNVVTGVEDYELEIARYDIAGIFPK